MTMLTSRNDAAAVSSLQAEFSGAAGLASFPARAAAANGVSLAEVLRYIQEAREQSIQKVQTLGDAATTALFTVTGGPIIAKVVGIVTTILSGTSNGTLQATTTAPASTTALSTTVAIDNDAAGTSYRFVGATGVLTPVTAGAKIIDPVTVADCQFLVPIGNVNFLTSGNLTGVITWYMQFWPLSPLSTVVAA